MLKSIAAADMGVVLDTTATTASQNDGAVYNVTTKKWDFTKRSWK